MFLRKVVVSGIHWAILGREWLTLCLYKLQLVLYIKSQNCACRLPGIRATKNAVYTFCLVRNPWALAAGLVGSRWVDLAGEHFDHMCFLQWKVNIMRPHAQILKIVT